MSGNTEAASLWADANVYVTDDLTAQLPASSSDPMPEVWNLVGLLDGDDGFVEARSQDSNSFYAWGQVLVRTSTSNFSMTRKFTALEDNAIVAGIVYPGSTPTKIRVPKKHIFKIVFETIDGDNVKRLMSTRYVEVSEVADITESETALTKYEVTVTVFATADGDLFDVQSAAGGAPTLTSIATSPQTKTVKVGEYAPLTAVATWSDASTTDVSKSSAWSSSAPAKATVDGPYLHGVATGATNVTARYKGQNATTNVTVAAAA